MDYSKVEIWAYTVLFKQVYAYTQYYNVHARFVGRDPNYDLAMTVAI